MAIPRSVQIDTTATPYYHCVSRCVRRAFLCGEDAASGRDFSHRRAWLEARLHQLAGAFTVDLCAYAVMSNHYHVVLHINSNEQKALSDADVIARWRRIFRLPDGFDDMSEDARQVFVDTWRCRLGSISWFMRSINEPLARWANREDGCKGRFWEGRFRSQALLDEQALLKCMAYVDLNPIRAKRATRPENSKHTSIYARLQGARGGLAAMADEPKPNEFSLPLNRQDYYLLVDTTGRALIHGKRGRIEPSLPPILQRVVKDQEQWLRDMARLTRLYARAIGSAVSLRSYREHLGQSRLNGVSG